MPGAGFAIKEWPVESYGRAARHLSGRHGLGLVIAGRARDREKARRIGEIAGVVPIDLTGRLGLVQLVALVARAALVLGNDSAGIHLAAALDRKGIAVSGGTALIEFHPYPEAMHPTVRFVYPRIIREAESYRAYADGNLTGGRIPVSEVEVEAVVQAIDALLA
jgi:ADP-heptose:LPS heptosyltransferase